MDLRGYQIQKPNPHIHTRSQSLGDEIFQFFNKKLPFPRIMRIIKTAGEQEVYQVFNEIRQSKSVKNPLALFIWRFKKKLIHTPSPSRNIINL